MLKIYRDTEGTVRSGGADDDLPGHVIWMDLLNPDEKEIEFVRRRAKVRVPTREALSEIEASSRLSKEGNRIYLSAPVIAHATLEHDRHRAARGRRVGKIGREPDNVIGFGRFARRYRAAARFESCDLRRRDIR